MNFGPSLEGKNKGFKYTETLCRRYPSFTLKKIKSVHEVYKDTVYLQDA